MRRVAVWLNPGHVGLIRAVVERSALRLVAAGSPSRGHSTAVAAELETEPFDDLRAILAGVETDLVLIAAPDRFGDGSGAEDAEGVLAAHARGVRIATLEPIPASALDLGGGWTAGEHGLRAIDVVRFVPLSRIGEDVLASFGPVRTVAVESWASAAAGSLGARVYGGMAAIASLMGEPEKVDAAYVSPSHGTAVHALPGETLRGLSGEITACMRFADGRAAALVASDQGGRWSRSITLIGAAGRLRVTDSALEWVGPNGAVVDETRAAKGIEHRADADAIGGALDRLLEPGSADLAPLDHATVLAMTQAMLLSARTGEAESPSTIRRMVGTA
jgi:predicted dehydrogenase